VQSLLGEALDQISSSLLVAIGAIGGDTRLSEAPQILARHEFGRAEG
jgi:hypothetical protein